MDRRYFLHEDFSKPIEQNYDILNYDVQDAVDIKTVKRVKQDSMLYNAFLNIPGSGVFTKDGEYRVFKKYNYLKYLSSNHSEFAYWGFKPEYYLDRAIELRDSIIVNNIRLLVSRVTKKLDFTPDRKKDDLISNAQEILIKCVDKFDYNLGFKFSTYAVSAINFSFRDTEKEEKLKTVQAGEAYSVVSRYKDISYFENKNDLDSLLKRLSSKEREIIELRYGLCGKREMSLIEIGQMYLISKQRAQQIVSNAITKLREFASYE